MKKLLKNSTIAFAMLSFFIVSCDKEPVKTDPVKTETKNDLVVKYKFQRVTGKVESGSGTGTFEIKDGEQVKYTFIPTCPCSGGKFTHTKPDFIDSDQDSATGVVHVSFKGKGKAAWVVTITCTCPDGVEHTAEITIIIE